MITETIDHDGTGEPRLVLRKPLLGARSNGSLRGIMSGRWRYEPRANAAVRVAVAYRKQRALVFGPHQGTVGAMM
jgi:hypothetical protein